MNKLLILVFTIFLIGCSKEDEDKPSSSSGSSTDHVTTSCSTITASGTITHNGVNYKINAISGSGSTIGIEVINQNGPFTSNYAMKLLQVTNGSSCYEASNSIEGVPGIGKFFEFQNIPSWAISTSTVSKIYIKLDGINYYIQDLNLDQN